MSPPPPPRVLFSQLPFVAPLGNAETEEHEENAQDENEDDGPFAFEALSDSEEEKNPDQVPVTGRRFKETLREEKPPRTQVAFKIIFCVGNSRLQRLRLPDKHPASIDTVARQPSAEAFILLEWLDSFFLSQCERQHADGKYHLPNNFTKKVVYDHYRTDMVQIDGMDQKKTALPHFSKQPKSVDGAALVGVHLVGAMIFHGIPQRDEHAVDEPVAVTTTEEFRRRIFGQRRPIYSGPRRPPPGSAAADRAAHIGELTEIHDKSFLAVLADDETSFWICQVLKINRRNEEGEPTSVHIQWYATEDSNPYTGKFYPEKRKTNGKGRASLFRQEIDLEEVIVLSFNFNFTTARRLRKITERQIRTGLFRIARDKEASQPEVPNRLSQAIDSVDDEETECSGPDLEDEEE
ncbi:hypothetical protein R1sor_023915 [Riccia sorocarpa]|uniref:BAH domain-containing protein n=1 Tax=Riccia sorocarpa TaxID=122646 RepID=A0ABD3GUX8_9MARC